MHIRSSRGWELPESAATPEAVFLNRRSVAAGLAAGPILLALGTEDGCADDNDPTAKYFPAKRNDSYKLDRTVTPEALVTSYNNYYEFGSSKDIVSDAAALPIRPWTIEIDGMVQKPITIAIDDLLAKMPIQERLYRHRCVEAWSFAAPWTGFPLKSLVDLAQPLSSATYVQFSSFENPDVADGQKASWYPWPYLEGVTMAEATNDLAFLVIGAYGKPLPKQNGAPLRLALPWKYGFKSAKGLVRFTFTDKQPVNFWQALQASEYGFWANVNPDVPHPRWSQATERELSTGDRVPTLLFNGYADQVAGIYKNLQNERLYA